MPVLGVENAKSERLFAALETHLDAMDEVDLWPLENDILSVCGTHSALALEMVPHAKQTSIKKLTCTTSVNLSCHLC